jgi:hypothetical protein
MRNICCSDLFDVFEPGDIGPMPLKDGAAEWVDLALKRNIKTSALKPEIKTTNPAEE